MEQDKRQEWLSKRKQGIGGSDIGVLLGINPFRTRMELWLDKKSSDVKSESGQVNASMQRGNDLEAYVALLFERETGHKVYVASEDVYVHPEKDFLRASVDRFYTHSDTGEECILECKTTSKMITEDNIPVYWYAQLQWYLGILGRKRGVLAWLNPFYEFRTFEVEFDPVAYAAAVEEAEKFWQLNVLADVPPEPETIDDVRSLYQPKDISGALVATVDLLQMVKDHADIKASISALEAQAKQLEDGIGIAMGDKEELVFGEDTLVTFKFSKAPEKFNTKAFKQAHPDLHKQFVTLGSPGRRLLNKLVKSAKAEEA